MNLQPIHTQAIRTIADRLAQVPIGETISFQEISRAYGRDISSKSYLIHSAFRLLNKENGALFVNVRKFGYRRLLPEQTHEIGGRVRQTVRRRGKRAASMMSRALSVANDMPNAAKKAALSEMATLGLLTMLATDKRRIEIPDEAVAPPSVTDVARSVLRGLGGT